MRGRSMAVYQQALLKANAEVGKEEGEKVCFNGFDSPLEYRIGMLELESEVFREMAALIRLLRMRPEVGEKVRNRINYLEDAIGVRYVGRRHTYLKVVCGERSVLPEELSEEQLKLLDEYLKIQRDSFLAHRDWVDGVVVYTSSGYYMDVSEAELAELLCAVCYSGVVKGYRKFRQEDLIRYVCRTWNLPFPKDVYSKMARVMERSNPVAFLDRIRERMLDHAALHDGLLANSER